MHEGAQMWTAGGLMDGLVGDRWLYQRKWHLIWTISGANEVSIMFSLFENNL